MTTVDILSGINLDGGDDSIHNDFAEMQPASISGYVYVDANNNGVFDPGETPIGGVQLTLLGRQRQADRPDGHDRRLRLLSLRRPDARHLWRGRDPARRILRRARRGRHGQRHGRRHGPQPRRPDRRHRPAPAARSAKDYDFGELLPASISGQVFVDNNGNDASIPASRS